MQTGELDALIGQNQAIGLGLTLTRGRYGIQVEPEWSHFANVQLEDRLHRIGQTLPVQWDYLVIDRSIDAVMVKAALWKADTAGQITGDDYRRLERELLGEEP